MDQEMNDKKLYLVMTWRSDYEDKPAYDLVYASSTESAKKAASDKYNIVFRSADLLHYAKEALLAE